MTRSYILFAGSRDFVATKYRTSHCGCRLRRGRLLW